MRRRPCYFLAAMALVAGLRAFGAKWPSWLRRSPWAPLSAGFCSPGSARPAGPESEPRLTSTRQQDGIRSACGQCQGSPLELGARTQDQQASSPLILSCSSLFFSFSPRKNDVFGGGILALLGLQGSLPYAHEYAACVSFVSEICLVAGYRAQLPSRF